MENDKRGGAAGALSAPPLVHRPWARAEQPRWPVCAQVEFILHALDWVTVASRTLQCAMERVAHAVRRGAPEAASSASVDSDVIAKLKLALRSMQVMIGACHLLALAGFDWLLTARAAGRPAANRACRCDCHVAAAARNPRCAHVITCNVRGGLWCGSWSSRRPQTLR